MEETGILENTALLKLVLPGFEPGQKPETVFVYEYVHGDDPNRRIWAVWSPSGT